MKKTSNAEHRTPNIELADVLVVKEAEIVTTTKRRRIQEQPERGYHPIPQTPNAQRSTFNSQAQKPVFDLEDRLLEFSARIIEIVDDLPNTRAANHIAGQLLRCGTSPYGNHGEVEAAESRRDFVHKLGVCLKELKETNRWLRLISRASLLPETKTAVVLREIEELIKIFFTSIRTARRNGA